MSGLLSFGAVPVAVDSDPVNRTSYPFTLSVRDETLKDYQIVCVGGTSDKLTADLIGCRMNGAAIAELKKTVYPNEDVALSGIFIAETPAGPDADYIIDYLLPQDENLHSCAIRNFNANLASATPYDKVSCGVGAGVPALTTVAVPDGGIVILVAAGANRPGPFTVIGVDKVDSFDKEHDDWFVTGFKKFEIGDPTLEVGVVSNNGNTLQEIALTVVSFAPNGQAKDEEPPSGTIDPETLSGIFASFDAARGVTKDGSNVVSDLANQAGSGPSIAGTNRPTWVANAVNGLPAITFVDDVLFSSLFAAIQPPFNVFMVMKLNAVSNAKRVFHLGADAGPSLVVRSGPKLEMQKDAQVAGPQGNVDTSAFHVLSMVFNGTGSSIAVDAGAPVTSGANLDGDMDKIVIGAQTAAGANAAGFALARLVIVVGALTATERTGVAAFLAEQYGLG